jgi:hypothetical protein
MKPGYILDMYIMRMRYDAKIAAAAAPGRLLRG